MQIVGGLATLIILVILYRIFHHSTQVQVLRPLTTDTPTASIIIPAYNEENSIERTIRSLMNQTYKPKYVVVVANNCSDRTAEVVTGLQTEYDNLLLDVMDNNPDKKSGALNRALEVLSAAAGLTHQEALATLIVFPILLFRSMPTPCSARIISKLRSRSSRTIPNGLVFVHASVSCPSIVTLLIPNGTAHGWYSHRNSSTTGLMTLESAHSTKAMPKFWLAALAHTGRLPSSKSCRCVVLQKN